MTDQMEGALIAVTKFDPSTGQCFGTLMLPAAQVSALSGCTGLALGAVNSATHYLDPADPSRRIERPEMTLTVNKTTIAADGADELVITGIPTGALVTVPGFHGAVDDGTVVYTTAYPGPFRVRVDRFPYRPQEIEVNAR